ncbi:hypothetical protein EYB45_09495 [Erythrobacteraceae bacterium CFH 75059]|uniref:hypothetical protein n=1 Tax=Qipengyuania thermophila TaxID=2509361 RepID=UPI0010219A1D|nr:hypothetical protein [Qipengyuania thermophila]TCD02210.1 hypothetical protein EYB45_09495 [Erythrobacteraceae bacterium CFH 75059]
MKKNTIALAAAATALVAAPVAAQSANARITAPVAGASELGGEGIAPAFIIAAIAGIAIGVLLLIENDDDRPVSR